MKEDSIGNTSACCKHSNRNSSGRWVGWYGHHFVLCKWRRLSAGRVLLFFLMGRLHRVSNENFPLWNTTMLDDQNSFTVPPMRSIRVKYVGPYSLQFDTVRTMCTDSHSVIRNVRTNPVLFLWNRSEFAMEWVTHNYFCSSKSFEL